VRSSGKEPSGRLGGGDLQNRAIWRGSHVRSSGKEPSKRLGGGDLQNGAVWCPESLSVPVPYLSPYREREIFIDNRLVRVH